MGKNDAMIELAHVTKRYRNAGGQVEALRDVCFRLEPGEFAAVLGPSGSGKTTLMNILGCLDSPTQGSYRLMGRQVGGLPPDQIARLRNRTIGFIFQSFNLVPALTALENVELPLAFRGQGKGARRALALEALEQVGLADRAGHRPRELSGGQQQRVAVARAIAARPALILADEPTGNLDRPAGDQVMALLRRLNRQGCAIVLITHDPQAARQARRRLRMEQGRLTEQGTG